MTAAILREHFDKILALPEEASDFLCNLFDAIQIFDDYADGDSVDRPALNYIIWYSFVGLNTDPFFKKHGDILMPLLGSAVLKWQASDMAERAGEANEVSFVWRAGYYDIVLMVVLLVHGPAIATEMAQVVMSLYGETYNDYREEFQNA